MSMDRRKFITKATLSSLATLIGTEIVFGANILHGYQPVALQDPDPFKLFKKDSEMVVLNDKPWNIEAKAHLLDDKITPNKYMFVRNNGLIPEAVDVKNWTLIIDGESVAHQKKYPKSSFHTGGLDLGWYNYYAPAPGGPDPLGTMNSSMSPPSPTHDVEKEAQP